MKLKKFRLGSLSDKMSDKMLKSVVGGYNDDESCYRYCYTYGGIRTMWSWLPNCYEHYHFCTQRGEIADCSCWIPGT